MRISRFAFLSSLALLPKFSHAVHTTVNRDAFQDLAKNSNTTTNTTTSTGYYPTTPTDHQIVVGDEGKLIYNPSNINATPGDTVTFIFRPKNHTVTQSIFEHPCTPHGASKGMDGFKSGFRPVNANVTSGYPTFQITINDTKPIWGYCGQTGHCSQGMVFAINAPTSGNKTFSAFQELAKNTNTTMTNTTNTTSTGYYSTTNHEIIVGDQGKLIYNPSNINATPGDTVTFIFRPNNHTVTQSSFEDPCTPQAASTGMDGFKSGFRPVNPNATSGYPTFQITINDTKPIWGYCGQTGHCSQGMVFAINAPTSGNKTFSAFEELAKNSNTTMTNTTNTTMNNTTMDNTSNTTSTGYHSTTDHEIIVGDEGKLIYNPSNITAGPGDTVTFIFRPKNHTVTQSTFGDPCTPAQAASTGVDGFKSGFRPVNANVTSGYPTFQITINDSNPIWGYCGQTGHCSQGMVFSINAPTSGNKTFEAFLNLAKANNGSNATGVLLGGSSVTGDSAKKIAEGAMIAIIIGLAFLMLVSLLLCYCCSRGGGRRGILGGGFLGFGGTKYRPVDAPSPEAAVDTHLNYQPPVPKNGEASGYYQDTYDPTPPPPFEGQYSTAWDQHK